MLELAPHLAYNFFDKQCLPLFRGRVMILVRLFRVCASALLCAGALLFPENASANGAGTVVDGRAILKMSKGSNLCALTFDDGPSRHTGRLMEILRERGIHATFFVVGKQVKYHPELIVRLQQEGHEIGNHTYTHPLRSGSSDALLEEAAKTTELLESTFDYSPVLFRPPGGNISGSMIESICASGYKCVLWSWRMDTRDWASPPVESVVQTVLRDVKFGDIILFHDNVYGTSPTAEALEIILPELIERGYSFVTVSELIAG